MGDQAVRVLVVSGTIGVGKTSVMEAAGDLLIERGIPSAMIDLDWLGQVHPPPPDDPVLNDLIVENLSALWPNLRRRGVRCLVAARLIRSVEIWDNYRSAIPDAEWTLVRAAASPGTIAARLSARHAIDVSPAILERHMKRSLEVTPDLDERAFEDIRVVNEGSLRAVAEEVLARWKVG